MTYISLYVIIPIIVFFISLFSRKKEELGKYFYIFVATLSVIGYDNVYDYDMYVDIFIEIYNNGIYAVLQYENWENMEIGYLLFNKLFMFSSYGYVFLSMVILLIYYHSLYTLFRKFNVLLLGTFYIFYLMEFDYTTISYVRTWLWL